MATLAQHRSGSATFVETKYLAIASQPVESPERLAFAPDHPEKRTLRATPQNLAVARRTARAARRADGQRRPGIDAQVAAMSVAPVNDEGDAA